MLTQLKILTVAKIHVFNESAQYADLACLWHKNDVTISLIDQLNTSVYSYTCVYDLGQELLHVDQSAVSLEITECPCHDGHSTIKYKCLWNVRIKGQDSSFQQRDSYTYTLRLD